MKLKFLKQCIVPLAVVLLFICCFSMTASAVWDGQGLPAGGSANTVTGDFSLPYDDLNDITGYRFTVYDKDGKKDGNGIDLYFKGDKKYYRNARADKKGHMEYYQEYLSAGTTKLGKGDIKYLAPPATIVDAGLPTTPTEMKEWLNFENALAIAAAASAETFEIATSYIIVEPLYMAELEGDRHYSLTLAEYAVYQATQYGWKSFPTNNGNSYGTIASYLGAIFPRHLYAVKEYNVFKTSPIEDSMLKKTTSGVNAILVGSSNSYNTAQTLLKYQMGMGIYTHVDETFIVQYRNYYDTDYGEGIMHDQKIIYGEDTPLSANKFTREGYRFIGWKARKTVDGEKLYRGYNSSGVLNWYSESVCDEYGYYLYKDQQEVHATVPIGETVTMWAQWERDTFTVKYRNSSDADYGKGIMPDQVVQYGVDTPLYANKFTRDGYHFTGWKARKTVDGEYLYKGYNSSGESGWYSASVCDEYGYYIYKDQQKVGKTVPPGETVIMWAQWELNSYIIEFDGNGATSGSTASLSMKYDVAANLTPNGFKRTGYTFYYWSTKPDGTGKSYSDKQSVKNLTATNGDVITLYAIWMPNSYVIEFDGNGATSGSTSSLYMKYDIAEKLTPNGFKRTGYTFYYWNTKPDGTGKSYSDKQNVKNLTATDGDVVTLYAIWTPNSYVIEFDGNGATSGSTPSLFMRYGIAANLTPNGFERTGYTFYAWNTKPDGSGVFYNDRESVKNLTTTDGSTITMYAQWAPNILTINYYSNGADYCTVRGTPISVSTSTNKLVYTQTFAYDSEVSYGLTDVQNKDYLYLSKTGYTPMGKWGTTPTGGILVDQTTSFDTAQELASLFELSLATGSQTIDLYAQWNNSLPHFVDTNGNWVDEGSITIYVGNAFNPLDHVAAVDKEDGDLTPEIVIVSNNVPVDEDDNTTTVGTFTVEYSVEDSAGGKGSYILTVNVIEVAKTDFGGRIRFINKHHIDTLLPNSKWRINPLNSILTDVLKKDVGDTSSSEQVWEFSAKDFQSIRKWCLQHDKGSATNKEFLEKFKDTHRTK